MDKQEDQKLEEGETLVLFVRCGIGREEKQNCERVEEDWDY